MARASGNIFAELSDKAGAEEFMTLLAAPHLTIERIVSTGQATPPGQWLEQDRAEWVILLQGAAALSFEGEASPQVLSRGDYVAIAPRRRHRLEWTAPNGATVWLAVHFDGDG